MGQQIEQRPFRVQEFRGYALNFAARLEVSVPHTILRLIQARSHLSRQVFFAAAAEIDLVCPEAFLAQIEVRAADLLADFQGLDPDARIARALAVMTPRTTIECLYGSCPDGLLGLFGRFGSQPVYGPEIYRLAFELFSRHLPLRTLLLEPLHADEITPPAPISISHHRQRPVRAPRRSR